eukprot:3397179-Amphidinium_carterae.1
MLAEPGKICATIGASSDGRAGGTTQGDQGTNQERGHCRDEGRGRLRDSHQSQAFQAFQAQLDNHELSLTIGPCHRERKTDNQYQSKRKKNKKVPRAS